MTKDGRKTKKKTRTVTLDKMFDQLDDLQSRITKNRELFEVGIPSIIEYLAELKTKGDAVLSLGLRADAKSKDDDSSEVGESSAEDSDDSDGESD